MKTNDSPDDTSNLANSRSANALGLRWLFPGIVSLVAALALTFLFAPRIAGFFNVPLPPWLSTVGIQENPLGEGTAEDTGVDVTPEEWPTPPSDLLAASETITQSVASATRTPPPTLTPLSTPTKIVLPTPAWSEMNHLTSVKFTAATIVEAERETNIALLGDVRTDRLLLKAVGDIHVGIDLSEVRNVDIDGNSIQLSLPAPEVIAVEILPKESQIYESTRTLFLSQYDGFESEAMEQARQQLRIEILQNQGLMELARDKSRLQLTEFLESVGFKEITIDFPYLDSSSRG